MSKGVWPYVDSTTPQPRCEAVAMLQLLSCGQTIEQLRADIIGKSNDLFRNEVLRHFDELVREGRVAEVIEAAKERSAKLTVIATAREQATARRHRYQQTRARFKRVKHGGRRARLNVTHCDQIRKLLASGMTRAQIGERFQVTGTTISRTLALAEAK